jgi:hypothetical protein
LKKLNMKIYFLNGIYGRTNLEVRRTWRTGPG